MRGRSSSPTFREEPSTPSPTRTRLPGRRNQTGAARLSRAGTRSSTAPSLPTGGPPGARNEDVFVAVDDSACGSPRFRRGDCDGDGLITFVVPILLLFANFA